MCGFGGFGGGSVVGTAVEDRARHREGERG